MPEDDGPSPLDPPLTPEGARGDVAPEGARGDVAPDGARGDVAPEGSKEAPPPRPAAALAFEVLNEIGIIAQLSRAAFEARLPDGFILPHFSVLNHLIRVGDGPTPLALARAFQVPKTSMTHTLAGLARAGLVDLRPNPEDGRSKRVWLTAAGRRFRDDAIAALGPDIGALLAAVPEAELRAALAPLTRLRRHLDAARDGRAGPAPAENG